MKALIVLVKLLFPIIWEKHKDTIYELNDKQIIELNELLKLDNLTAETLDILIKDINV